MTTTPQAPDPVRPRPGRPATMVEVAAAAGVSLKTVSRVVNREDGVSPAVTRRVTDALGALGYRHHHAASSLRRADRRTATIGLLLEDVANPFSSSLHRAVEDVARRHGSLVLAASSDNDPAREREVLQALAPRVDGLIVMPADHDHTAPLGEHSLGTPLVFVDRPDPTRVVDSVVTDNRAGAVLAVAHLQRAGHRRIAFLGDRHDLWTAAERLAGFQDAVARTGGADPRLVLLDVLGSDGAEAAVTSLLAQAEPPTAVFAAQNVLTIGAVRALQRAGCQRRVALVGFDDFPVADLVDPGLTVVAQDVAELGRRAAEMLFQRISGSTEQPRLAIATPVLLARGSGELPA